jgi:hypothetical protein
MLMSGDSALGDELFALSKAKSSPDIYSERQMRCPEWDEPKSLEVAKIFRLNAMSKICADDPSVQDMVTCECLWTGRCKHKADGSVEKYNARCCGRGDLDKGKLLLTPNDCTSPVARNSSNLSFDAVGCLRAMHKADYDVPGAYLQGKPLDHERRLYRPPHGFREWDKRGVEILWFSNAPLYGQSDAGAIWNRTVNHVLTSDKPPHGCGLERCPHDPSVYGSNVYRGLERSHVEGQCNNTLYVDDGRLSWDDDKAACSKTSVVKQRLADRFGIKFGDDDPPETHFLGSNILTSKDTARW